MQDVTHSREHMLVRHLRWTRAVPLLLFVAVLMAAGVARPVSVRAVEPTTRTASVVSNGAWCWFQDPRAVHHVGRFDRTYVGYVTSAGDIEVVSIDAGTGLLTHTTLHPKYQADDHAAPGILVLPDGRVAVFYSPHQGSMMNYRVSTSPEDVSAFGAEQTVPTNTTGGLGFTYANPIYLSAENRTYLFFRGGNYKPTVTSSTDLVHWTPAQTVVYPDVGGAAARPYVKYATNGTDTILLAFGDGHPRDVPTDSVYTLLLKDGVFRTVDGHPLAAVDASHVTASVHALPVHTNEIPKVYDGAGSGGKAWVHSAALDANGNPVVAFAAFPRDNTPTDTDHRYHYAHWNGTSWTSTEFARAGGAIDTTGSEEDYSGGMDLDRGDPSTLYASRQVGSAWHVERWHTPDGGATFDPPVDLTAGSAVKNVRPVVPWGPAGDVKVLWMSGTYNHWVNQPGTSSGYDTALRMLTSGPAPTTARISTTATSVATGQSVTIAARRVAGWQGSAVPGTAAELWSVASDGTGTLLSTGTADGAGLVQFPVKPTTTTRYEVRFPASGAWGAATSPSVTVNVSSKRASAVRISVDKTVVRPGQPVLVGMRVVNASTGLGVAGVPVQLWQTVDGHTWVQRVSLTTDGGGLARTTRNPTTAVTYQARFPGTSVWASSVSSTVAVAMG